MNAPIAGWFHHRLSAGSCQEHSGRSVVTGAAQQRQHPPANAPRSVHECQLPLQVAICEGPGASQHLSAPGFVGLSWCNSCAHKLLGVWATMTAHQCSRGRGETRPDLTEPWEVWLLGRRFLSQEMMMTGTMMWEAFVTVVTKDHYHGRPDKPRYASTRDGVSDTTANLPGSTTFFFFFTFASKKAACYLVPVQYLCMFLWKTGGFWCVFNIADVSWLWIRKSCSQNYSYLSSHWLQGNIWAHAPRCFPKTQFPPVLYVCKNLLKLICCAKTVIIRNTASSKQKEEDY